MIAKYCPLFLLSGLLWMAASCGQKGKVKTATQIMTERMDHALQVHDTHLDQMADNALLHEMCVADHHFIPHSAELSGTGVVRLDHLAPYLDTYGGIVRYETYSNDEALVNQRMEHVREYLTLAGCDMDRVKVERMMSGGRDIPAEDAMEIKRKGTAVQTAAPGGANQGLAGAPVMKPSGN